MARVERFTPDAAAALAGDALIWLAERPEEIGALLAASGLAPADLRARSGDPAFLGFVLDFVLADEARARGFAQSAGLGPETTLRARAALPGGDAPHWS